MIRVKLTTSFPEWPMLRQTPAGSGLLGGCHFILNDSIDECDIWVVYDDLLHPIDSFCTAGAAILYVGEPATIKRYNEKFLSQFDFVISCYQDMPHPNVQLLHPASPWHIGRSISADKTLEFRSNYESLQSSTGLLRKPGVSVVVSNKDHTEGHRRRLRFVEQAKAVLGDKLSVFGRGISEISDKADVIGKYEYHLVLENSLSPNYWTEKLADCFLGEAYPFYSGCPNIYDYFPENSLSAIDISKPEASIETILKGLASSLYASHRESISEAKRLVLFKHNLFAVLADTIGSLKPSSESKRIYLRPSASFEQHGSRARWRLSNWFA